MQCRATYKTNGSWWSVLTKCTQEKETANQNSCLENLKNGMKRQKDKTLKDELPRLVGVQQATEEERRNSSKKNEEAEPKKKQCPVVGVSGGETLML